MTKTLEIPDRIYRRVEQRVGRMGYSVPKLTTQLYMIWLDGGVQIEDVRQASQPPEGGSEYDFSDLAGKLRWTGDAVMEQRRMRDAW